MKPEAASLNDLDEQQLRALAQSLIETLAAKDKALSLSNLQIQKLTQELAILRRLRYGRISEQMDAHQGRLFEEDALADVAAIEAELAALQPAAAQAPARSAPRRQALPAELPRTEIRHEPERTHCGCGCQLERIGEDISEKLDYTPGSFSVERHIRGRWACRACEQITQAPMPAYVIDRGIPTPGLLAQVLVAKYGDHLPLYRQQGIYAREGVSLPTSTLSEWVGACGQQLQPLVDALKVALLSRTVLQADETPVLMLRHTKAKGAKPKVGSHRAYLWVYGCTAFDALKAVVYDFTESRAGEHCRAFLGSWQGKLVTDDFSGYKASFAQGITEIGCMAHARRKFFELYQSHQSPVAEQTLALINQLYAIEREAAEMSAPQRQRWRQDRAGPVLQTLNDWLQSQRRLVPDGSGTARAIDYSLNRWEALVRYRDDGEVPIDNNWIENQIRPIAAGRKNWLFAGSLRAGQRAAAVMSLIQTARLNGHHPVAYLKDVLTRLPTTKQKDIETLLPQHWVPSNG